MGRIWLTLTAFVLCVFAGAQGTNQGANLYATRCAVCHGIQGQGTPGLYPPLAGSLGRLLALPEARAYVVWVVRYGLSGAIASGGGTYKGVMPAHPGFSLEELVALLNHLLSLNSSYLPSDYPFFTLDEVGKYLEQSKTPFELHKLREELVRRLGAKGLPPP